MLAKPHKRSFAAVLLFSLALAACNKPQAPSSARSSAPAPFTTPQPQPERIALTSAVIDILDHANRGGSLMLRGACAPERQIQEAYLLPGPLKLEPFSEAMDVVTRQYPELSWRDAGAFGVRVRDNSLAAGLLRVRIKNFVIVEDRGTDAALSALWRAPEVINYMANHNVRFARQPADTSASRRKRTLIVLKTANGTVQQIVDSILAQSAPARTSGAKFWLYRECQSGSETLVDLRIL